MLIAGEGFPYTPLQEKDKNQIVYNCGGPPLSNTDYLRNFLRTSGIPTLDGILNRNFFVNLGLRSLRALDVPDSVPVRSFNRGVLMYAGVIREICKVPTIPFQDTIIKEAAESNGKNFALESLQRIKEEAENFCDLLGDARIALETNHDDLLHDLTLMGAGALHIITTRSVDLLSGTNVNFEALHPELIGVDPLSEYEADFKATSMNEPFDDFGDSAHEA